MDQRVLIAIGKRVERRHPEAGARSGCRGGARGSAADQDVMSQFKIQNSKCKLKHWPVFWFAF